MGLEVPGVSSSLEALRSRLSNYNAPGVVTKVNQALSQISVIAPKGVRQIDAFAFDYKGDDVVDLSADATDNWLEDNHAAQDHISIKPVIVTLSGFVAELSMSSDLFSQFSGVISGIQNGLAQADAYLGRYTPGMTDRLLNALTQVQNVVIQAEQALARGNQVLNLLTPGPKMNKQQKAFAQLSSLWSSRVLFTVYTPFRVFENMAIINIRAVQPKGSRTMSDFIVTMKQFNFTDNFVDYEATFGGWSAFDHQPLSANGGTTGTTTPLGTVTRAFPVS